jgi:hypothetical protein
VSLRPPSTKNFTPLYSGGLCEAEMTAPSCSLLSRATAGVGRIPPETASAPAWYRPRTSASSSAGPDARVSRPIRTWRAPHPANARPRRSTSSSVSASPTTPLTPSVPK